MSRRRWQQQVDREVEPSLATRVPRFSVEVPARRAGVARRRLRKIAADLQPHGYVLETVDPTRNQATGRFSIAHFRRAKLD